MRWIKALAAAVAIIAVAVGVPLLLAVFIGNPIPADVLGFNGPLSDAALLKLLSLSVWFLWAQTVWSLIAEAVAVTRSSRLGHIRGTFGIQQQIARVLIGAIVTAAVAVPGMAIASSATAETSAATTYEPTAAVSTIEATPAAETDEKTLDKAPTSAPAPVQKITVERGDTLWSLAETHLGDGGKWSQIADANRGRDMGGGHIFNDSDRIRAGWELNLPSSVAATEGPDTVTVKKGDTLSAIAQETTGDPANWPELFDASKDLPQPVALTDPNLIFPGQHIAVPAKAAPADRQAPEPAPAEATKDETSRTKTSPTPSKNPAAEGEGGLSAALRSDAAIKSEAATAPGAADTDAPTWAAVKNAASAAEDTAADQADTQLPGWITPGLAGGGVLLAGALLMGLRRRQAHQHRARRPGRVIATPDPELVSIEKSITVAGEVGLTMLELVDQLLSRLAATAAARREPLPSLAAVEVTETAVALHLRQPMPAPTETAWAATEDQLIWLVDRNVDLETVGPDGGQPAPWPLLVSIGADSKGGTWLLNLEDLKVSITGDPVAAADLARFVAAEIACNPWSRQTMLDLVGVAAEVQPMSPDRIRVLQVPQFNEAVTEAVHTVDRIAGQGHDIATARIFQDDPDTWPSRLVIVDGGEDGDELGHLVKLITTQRGGTGTAVVLSGTDDTDGFHMSIDQNQQLTIEAVNLTVTANGLTVEETHGCAALLAQADQTQDTIAPDLPTEYGWKALAKTTGTLRDQYRIPRSATLSVPAASMLSHPDEEYVAVTAAVAEDLDAVAPTVAETIRHQVFDTDPNLDTDLADWQDANCPRPRLSLLGPVAARTGGKALDKRRPFYTELFAYVATRTHGATTDEVATGLGLSPERVRIDINKLRGWLGTDPTTDEKYLPDARTAPSAKSRGIGVYEVPNALVDTDLFRRLRMRGEASGDAGIEDLVKALALVGGRPFSNLRTGGWGWMLEGDRLDQHMVCAIADVAHAVITHSLHAGDLARAQDAVKIALAAAPEEEIVQLDLAAVHQARGRHAEAAKVVREDICNRSDDGEAPVELTDRTEQIIANRGWLRQEAI